MTTVAPPQAAVKRRLFRVVIGLGLIVSGCVSSNAGGSHAVVVDPATLTPAERAEAENNSRN